MNKLFISSASIIFNPVYLVTFLHIASLMFISDAAMSQEVVEIPDANFKSCLLDNAEINTNGDDEIQVVEAEVYDGEINCWGESIADMTGIEAFTQIDSLDCSMNEIDSLDLTHNLQLEFLDCSYNGFSMTYLNISENLSLKVLRCMENYMLSDVDISNNLMIRDLYLDMVELDVSEHLALESLVHFGGQTDTLDLSNHEQLSFLWCTHSDIQFLNIQNGFNENLMMGDEPGINVLGNDGICVQVDDLGYIQENWNNWEHSAAIGQYGAVFSEDCFLTVSIDEPNEQHDLKLFPNPVSDQFTVDTNDDNLQLILFDANGTEMFRQKLHSAPAKVDVSHLSRGVYIVQIHSDQSVNQKRIVIAR